MAIIFDHEDEAYLNWADSHPQGVEVNAYRNLNPGYLILHRASCSTITGMPARGKTWTAGDFIKVCSESRQELERWARSSTKGDLSPCGSCHPE